MRLAFSVAINVDADILLIDEILGVGDANFQAKCFDKLREIKASGTTIVIVSHALAQIEQICERSIWIKDGLVEAEGDPKEVHMEYLDYMNQQRLDREEMERSQILKIEAMQRRQKEKEEAEKAAREKRYGSGEAQFSKLMLSDLSGKEKGIYRTGEGLRLDLEYEVHKKVSNVEFGIKIHQKDGVLVYSTTSSVDGIKRQNLDKDGKCSFIISNLMLLPGHYTIDVSIEYGESIPIDYYKAAVEFEMVSNVEDGGIVRIPHEWEM